MSAITTQFLEWSCQKPTAMGKKALLLIWDNASWHTSKEVRSWIEDRNREVKKSGRGVRIVFCLLPKKRPWLNPIEPKWIHGKRKVVEPYGLLDADELADRVCKISAVLTNLVYPFHRRSSDCAQGILSLTLLVVGSWARRSR